MTTRDPAAAGGAGPMIIRADQADTAILSQLIAEAFLDLAPSQWLIPDRTARQAIFPAFFGMYVVHAMTRGIVYTTPDRTAAALWIPSTGPAEASEEYDEQLAQITGPWAGRFVTFDQELTARHLTGVAHHHLAILAVRPDRQGQGIGTALLHAHHAALDQEGLAAYLEASDQRTRSLYLGHGYADYGGHLIQLPEGPSMYPMIREPRPGG